ncbi:MAG: ATP-binding cassette domain-containing protein, partial [Clostridia bacterium]|nr:ATP-binding cassette domain-containing protein [Clostridia bacterium]
ATVAKNIALCEENKIDRGRLRECMRLAGILDKVESLPQKENTLLVREVHEGAVAFSGGELQRLLLARALYKDAPIIILDEPTAALDPIAENDMYLKYSELTKDKTAIYISHRLSSTRFCDRIILLDDAKIAEMGTHEELLALGGKYAEMFETQSRYYREEAII